MSADKPKAFDSFEDAMRELARRREAEARKQLCQLADLRSARDHGRTSRRREVSTGQ